MLREVAARDVDPRLIAYGVNVDVEEEFLFVLPGRSIGAEHLNRQRGPFDDCPATVLTVVEGAQQWGYMIVRQGAFRSTQGEFELVEAVIHAQMAAQAISCLLSWAIERGCWRLQTAISPRESRGLTVLENCGFRLEGRKGRAFSFCEQAIDSLLLAFVPGQNTNINPTSDCISTRNSRKSSAIYCIRPAISEDGPPYAEFVRTLMKAKTSCFLRTTSEWATDSDEICVELERSRRSESILLLASTEGGKIAGAVRGERGILPRSSGEMTIFVGVLSHFQDQGVGRTLILALEDWSRAAGWVRLTAQIAVGNVASLRLFQSTGFTLEGRLVRTHRDPEAWVDCVVMGKLLQL